MASTPQTITVAQINSFQSNIDRGDFHGFYKGMQDKGYAYAGWADGVAQGNSLAGIAALEFLKGTALLGTFGNACRALTPDQISSIKRDMAQGYLDTLRKNAIEEGGSTSRDVNSSEVTKFHEQAFNDNGLSIENWTLDAPFKALEKLKGHDAVEQLWKDLRDTEGTGRDALLENTGVLNMMHSLKDHSDPQIRDMANKWLDNVPGFYDRGQFGRALSNLAELAKVSSPSDKAIFETPLNPGRTLWPGELDRAQELFDKARKTVFSPLVLDLGNDGIATQAVTNGVHFDHDGNGFAEQSGWITTRDGLLVLDLNNSGSIDSGAELFGNHTRRPDGKLAENGFDALSSLDTNGDGMVSILDNRYVMLKVWVDANIDGKSESSELHDLSEFKIISLSTHYVTTALTDENGNEIRQTGSFSLEDGSTRLLADVWFRTNLARTIATEFVDITENVSRLPDFAGSGNVPSLHQAIARDASGELEKIVKSITNAKSADFDSLIDKLILKWTGATDNAFAHGCTAEQYAVAALVGEPVGGAMTPGYPRHAGLMVSYNFLKDAIALKLVDLLPEIQQLNSLLSFDVNDQTFDIDFDVTRSREMIFSRLAADPSAAMETLNQYAKSLHAHSTIGMQLVEAYNSTSDDGKTLYFGVESHSMQGSPGSDILVNVASPSAFSAGLGNDHIYSGKEDNSFVFNVGDGRDDICDIGGFDKISFGPGITENDVSWTRQGSNLVISINASTTPTNDQLTILNWFDDAKFRLESMVFANGREIRFLHAATDGDDILEGDPSRHGIDGKGGNDFILDSSGIDTIRGGSGNDTIEGIDGGPNVFYGEAGADTISYSSASSNTIDGGEGDDVISYAGQNSSLSAPYFNVIIGGVGDDKLIGGVGSESYRFSRGDGKDVILDYDLFNGGFGVVDKIIFGTDIAQSDLTFSRAGDDLVVALNGVPGAVANDQITVQNWYAGQSYLIEQLAFVDGSVMSAAQVTALGNAIRSTEGNDTLIARADTTFIDGLGGDDTISGPATGNVTLRGGAGDDLIYYGDRSYNTVEGGDGNDVLAFAGQRSSTNIGYINVLDGGKGDDKLIGGVGSEIYRFSRGDGRDVIHDDDAFDGGFGVVDKIAFGTGVAESDLTFARSGDDLVIALHGAPGETFTDQITVQNWYGGRSYQIEQITFADGSVMTAAAATALGNVIRATEGNDTLIARIDTTFIDGLGGNDTITGPATGNATLRGGAGEDLIYYGHRSSNTVAGGEGNDVLAFAGQPSSISIGYVNILDGGKGDDKLIGGVGSEIYCFSRGDGKDVIFDDDAFDGGFGVMDKIAFGSGIAQSDLTFSRSRDDLVIALNGVPGETSTDQITVQNWYSGKSYQIEQIAFADGSTMSAAQATALGNVIRATEGNDTLIARADTTFIDGLGGNDTIIGPTTGNATLRGGAGDDLINYGNRSNNSVEGGDGNDVLAFAGQPSSISIGYINVVYGGKGDDKLIGGVGSEIYRFSRGDGRDVILDEDAFDGGFGVVDKIAFGSGVAQSDLTFSRSGDNLVIALNGAPGETSTDQITVQNWYGGRSYQIEQLCFDDGTMLQSFEVRLIGTSA